MNIVVFAAYATNTPHFETELELAHTHADDGDHVTVLTCGGEMESCEPNPYHDPPRCAKCMGRRDFGLKLVPPSIATDRFYRLTDEDRAERAQLRTRFDTHAELQDLKAGGFDLGYAALSSLISMTRDPEVDLTVHDALLRALLRAAWTVHRSMCRYLDTHDVDRVYLFNGRFAMMRAVLRACQEKGVECFTHERARDPSRYWLVPNTMSHDIAIMHDLIWDVWHAAGPDSDREAVARAWYEARAHGELSEGFVHDQQAGRLPADWDHDKRNITLFVSSEDEYAAVSDEWRNLLYTSQIEGIHAIIDSLEDDPGDVHLYIRAHPNMALIDNVQTREIARLDAPFLTVIPPADPADTYEMMRNSASVISFGSTTGIEAVYWGVPSILAAKSMFRDFGVTYNPATHEELIELMRQKLEPRSIEPALVYAFFWPQFGVPFKYFISDGFYSGRFKGVRIRPTRSAAMRTALLRLICPQRTVRHLKRSVTKRLRMLRNKVRPRA
ncbi:MAG: hypothetical protein ACYSU7_13910 [Planctomycetota bacterium]|jgi:hypothetical protein